MTDLCRLIFWTLVDLMRARATLEAEIWVLRQQINVLRRAAPRRQSFGIFEVLNRLATAPVFRNGNDMQVILPRTSVLSLKNRQFCSAGGAPRCPKVQENWLAAKRREIDRAASEAK